MTQYWLSRMLRQAGFAIALGLIVGACGTSNTPNQTASSPGATGGGDSVVGMVLVGPRNDTGWNQAHYEGIEGAIKNVPGTKLEFVDKVNPAGVIQGTLVLFVILGKGFSEWKRGTIAR